MLTPTRPFLKGLLLGATLALVVAIAFAIWLQRSSRIIILGVGLWVESAIKAEFVGLSVRTDKKVFAEFEFSTINTTNADYSLPIEVNAAFVRSPADKGLAQVHGLAWPSGQYLPPSRRVAVKFTVPFEFTETFNATDASNAEKLTMFVSQQLKHIDSFVVLDRTTRYEIAFPMPLRSLGNGPSTDTK